jgi:aryl-alcohol dehydrogenase-like predicted oxidoreductase
MEKRQLGRTGMEVTVLGFGGAEIGFDDLPQSEVDAMLHAALDAGLNIIDTAECYFSSEEKIGRAVGNRRDDFFLFTKCGHAQELEGDDWQPEILERSIERSLKRLQTDCVDLVQLHSCSAEILQRGEVTHVLQRARDAGKTRFIGYSGDGENALEAVRSGVFDTLQTSLSIADQEPLSLTLPEAHAQKMGVIAKRPIANAAWRHGSKQPSEDYHVEYWRRLRALDYDFLSRDDAASVALRFTLAAPGVGTAIVGTTNPKRWAENARALQNGPLTAQEIEAIRTRWDKVSGGAWKGQV